MGVVGPRRDNNEDSRDPILARNSSPVWSDSGIVWLHPRNGEYGFVPVSFGPEQHCSWSVAQTSPWAVGSMSVACLFWRAGFYNPVTRAQEP